LSTIAITETKKGARIWIQALESKGITGSHVLVSIAPDQAAIVLTFATYTDKPKGWRKVTQSKGGVVDLESKKVVQWAQGATQATMEVIGQKIIIRRAI